MYTHILCCIVYTRFPPLSQCVRPKPTTATSELACVCLCEFVCVCVRAAFRRRVLPVHRSLQQTAAAAVVVVVVLARSCVCVRASVLLNQLPPPPTTRHTVRALSQLRPDRFSPSARRDKSAVDVRALRRRHIVRVRPSVRLYSAPGESPTTRLVRRGCCDTTVSGHYCLEPPPNVARRIVWSVVVV